MKNIIIKLICILLFANSLYIANAQDSLTFKLAYIAVKMDMPALHIGDQLPGIENRMYHYNSGTLNLSDLKGKLVILHFWHQYCPYCVAQFRSIDSLQQQFKDKVVIILVTFQSEASVKEFYKTMRDKGNPVNLPSIVEDTLLRKYFPHAGDPHDVWIDASGTVRAVTEYRRLTAAAIKKAIDENDYRLPQRNHQFAFDPFEPFLINNNGGPAGAFVYRSMFSHYIDSIDNTGLVRNRDTRSTHLFLANASALDLYRAVYAYVDTALKLDLDYLNKRVIVETTDSERFRYWPDEKTQPQAYDDYLRNNVYCYELILPPVFNIPQAYKFMIDDLDKFFQCSSAIENRKVKTLKLVATGDINKLQTQDGKPTAKFAEESNRLTLINEPLSDLALMFNIYFKIPVVIDKTEYSKNIDIDLQVNDISSIEEINRVLTKNSLKLVLATEILPVLVLKNPGIKTGSALPVLLPVN